MRSRSWALNSPTSRVIHFDPADFRVSAESVGRYFGGSRYRLSDRARARISAGIDDALALAEPLAAVDVHPLEGMQETRTIRLKSAVPIELPCRRPHPGARYLSGVVATLGPGLDAACRRLAACGAFYQSTLLDAVGIALLDALACACTARLEDRARILGLHAGRRISPGTGGVSLDHQRTMFALVDADTIGVRLNADLVMTPIKSISFFSFFQTAREAADGRSKCARCGMAGCGFREIPEMPYTQENVSGTAAPAPASS
jgi:hypothetical protein